MSTEINALSNISTVIGNDTLNTNYFNPWPYYTPPSNIPIYYPYPIYYPVTTPRCAWCQGQHTDKCPRLKAVSYRDDGTVERVEFFEEGGR